VPIAPATIKPKPVAPKPAPGQAILLPAGSTAADVASLHGTPGLGNIVVLPNYVVRSIFNSSRELSFDNYDSFSGVTSIN